MDSARDDGREAVLEAALDAAEGADMLMVKPGLPYLDIVRRLREEGAGLRLPIAAYQVSGEYSMIKAAAARGWVDERRIVLETMTAFRRAGANAVVTYYAKQIAKWLGEGEAAADSSRAEQSRIG